MRHITIWRFTKHGFFTVKSAYHAAVSLYSPSNLKFCSASVIPTGWKKLWHIKAIPRVRLFIWKACSNSLPTKANLHKRHYIEDPICELCGEEAETVDHLLLHCATTHLVWYSSPLRLDTKKQEGLTFKEFVWSSIEKFPPEYVSMLALLAWEIWSARNAKYFENSPFEFQRITRKAMNRSSAGEELKETTLTQVRAKERMTVWKKPNFGRHKMNSDIAVWPDGRVGIGFLIRDHEGGVILAEKKEIQAEGNTNLLEGLAMLYGLQMALQYHITVDEVESDNKNTVESVTGKERPEIYMDIVVADIVDTTKKVGCINIIHGERLANKAAHHIAHGRDFISIRHCPNHVASFICQDVMTG